MTNGEELKAICDMAIDLTKLKQEHPTDGECFDIQNFACECFVDFLNRYAKNQPK